jgi:hypothetical protein
MHKKTMAKRKAEFKIGKGKLINHTSITDSEFGYLLPFFENAFDSYFKYHTLAGTARIRLACKRNDSVFSKAEDGLFFILFYLKSYPTEEVLATMFEMYQSQVNVWKNLLQNILEESFLSMNVLPSRENKKLNQLIKEMGLTEIIIDATEREIQRPKDNEVQKEYYSGKKRLIRSRTPLSVIKIAIM